MGRPVTDPSLTRAEFRLGAATLQALDEIAREAGKRADRKATRTDALRWAVRELRARLALEKLAVGTPTFTGPGPFTLPTSDDPKAP